MVKLRGGVVGADAVDEERDGDLIFFCLKDVGGEVVRGGVGQFGEFGCHGLPHKTAAILACDFLIVPLY